MTSTSDFIPPMLDGVTASKVFLKSVDPLPQTIFDYLCAEFPHISHTEWTSRFEQGLVYDALGNKLNQSSSYQANTHCFYYRFLEHEIHVPFEHQILFENEHLLVVDKPHFLTMSPTGQYVQETLLVRLKKQMGNPDLTPIHRLDRETAGIVLFSKTLESRGAYQQMFANRHVQKTYHAIAAFKPELKLPFTTRLRMEKGHPFYTMQVISGEPNSETLISLLEHKDSRAKYVLQPHTGKQHQLRVHLNYLGIPIENDPFYPVVAHKADDDFSAPLQLLAKEIEFIDPMTQQPMHFVSEFELTL
ncbi:pseudouridylate synthase [Acinetobacter sp. NCu2D-2]|uniref:RluA family pseudouridine synthase n=1 Tax=Acinetobacter sp. NCu2D-2 TaxID=1608473 RepID=UPI0007CDD1B0|nr:RluA family pseudouridine synthase [Acinetobacter sp. NCu2D-2]ANF82000.1 pseudouridylate synthase [Acinetobacter sp. NCu2D-2]